MGILITYLISLILLISICILFYQSIKLNSSRIDNGDLRLISLTTMGTLIIIYIIPFVNILVFIGLLHDSCKLYQKSLVNFAEEIMNTLLDERSNCEPSIGILDDILLKVVKYIDLINYFKFLSIEHYKFDKDTRGFIVTVKENTCQFCNKTDKNGNDVWETIPNKEFKIYMANEPIPLIKLITYHYVSERNFSISSISSNKDLAEQSLYM